MWPAMVPAVNGLGVSGDIASVDCGGSGLVPTPPYCVLTATWLADLDRLERAFPGKVIGKPADEADARRILTTLGGTVHELWTGVVLWRRPDDLQLAWQEVSRVRFKRLTDAELAAYLATRQWQGCSGAYAIQDTDDPYVQLVEGSMTNVVGLPMETLGRVLPLVEGRVRY